MGLQSVSGICCLTDSRVEAVVDSIEHVPHIVGALSQGAVNLSSESF